MVLITWSSGKTGKTGRRLRDALGVRSLLSYRGRYISKLIRWGDSVNEFNEGEVLNTKDAINNSANKLQALRMMKEQGVSVPWFTDNIRRNFTRRVRKYVGRTTYHQGGSNFLTFFPFKGIYEKQKLYNDTQSSHWLELISISKEWRVHVFQGEVIGVSRKTDEGVEWRITNKYTRNHNNGWRFIRCDLDLVQPRLKELGIEAVESLGLDFGAVDIILSDGNESTSNRGRKYYVLEVNSAPSLEIGSTILDTYIYKFRQWLN